MKIVIKKTPKRNMPRAATTTTTTPLSPVNATSACIDHDQEAGQVVRTMMSSSAALMGCDSRKRAPSHFSDPTHVHQPASSPNKKPASALAGPQDRMASLKSSSHQSEATKLANGCQMSVVEKSSSGLASALKTEPEDVVHDHIQASTSEGQGTRVSPLIKEEPDKTNGTAWCDHQTEKLSDQLPCSIDANFLQQVVVAFDEAKESQEERERLAKESISMNPNLQSTLLSILKKYGDITKDCPMESGYMLKSVLEVICKVVQELEKKHLTEVNCNLLDSYYLVVKDAEKLKLNVGWLRTRLDEIKDAVKSIVETKKLNDEKNRRVEKIRNEKKDLDAMKAELEKLKSEVEQKEVLLNLEALVTEELSSMINDRALRIQQFQNMPLMEPFL